MADYVSKYTGSEVDGILDEAIELPQATSDDRGKFLKYGQTGLEWDYIGGSSNASNGDVLKYSYNSGPYWDANPVPEPGYAVDKLLLVYDTEDNIRWQEFIDAMPELPYDNFTRSDEMCIFCGDSSSKGWVTLTDFIGYLNERMNNQ